MRNFVNQIGINAIKRFVRNWETSKRKEVNYVICKVDDSSKVELKIEARLYNGLFKLLGTDYWLIDDFYAIVNSPDEHTNNTMQLVKEYWQQYLLKQLLHQGNVSQQYSAEEYFKTLEAGSPRYMWGRGHSETNWPERLL